MRWTMSARVSCCAYGWYATSRPAVLILLLARKIGRKVSAMLLRVLALILIAGRI